MRSIISLYVKIFRNYVLLLMHLFLLRNTACLTEKNGILMHLALCTMPLYYLSEQPDVATGREHGSGFVLPGQAAQRRASRGDARQGKPSRCVGQARRERCPLVLKNTVCTLLKYRLSSVFLIRFSLSIIKISLPESIRFNPIKHGDLSVQWICTKWPLYLMVFCICDTRYDKSGSRVPYSFSIHCHFIPRTEYRVLNHFHAE